MATKKEYEDLCSEIRTDIKSLRKSNTIIISSMNQALQELKLGIDVSNRNLASENINQWITLVEKMEHKYDDQVEQTNQHKKDKTKIWMIAAILGWVLLVLILSANLYSEVKITNQFLDYSQVDVIHGDYITEQGVGN